jgi:DNA repair protein RadD
MPPQVLRPYQQTALADMMAAWRSGHRSVLAVSPTGSGKTTIFGDLTRALAAAGKRVVILAHRRELIEQASTRLREFGVQHGIVMAGVQPTPYLRVQVASIQTLVRRAAPPADLVVIDEAHLSTAQTYLKILDSYPTARILGVTATPWRLSGKPLAGAYDACVVVSTPAELRGQGFLSDYVGFSYLAPDVSKLKTTAGDYNERDSADAMSEGVIVDNIVEQWQAHASALSTAVFAVTVEHSRQLAERFRAAGVACEHLDGGTALEQRRAILARVASGQTRVLCNVGIAVEGLDIPRLKCCVLARPTKSLARAIQMMGRVRRPWNGVTARIHDHAFVIKAHGLPDAERDYSLTATLEKPPSLKTCQKCRASYDTARCPACSHENEPDPSERVLQTVSGDEVEQVGFTSSTETLEPPPRPVAPAEIQWATCKPGRVFRGPMIEQGTEPLVAGGVRRFYVVRDMKRDYKLPGTALLNASIDRLQVRIPDTVEIEYKGRSRPSDPRSAHLFRVGVDDDRQPLPDPREELKKEAIRLYGEGKATDTVAEQLGVSSQTVYQWCKDAGVIRSRVAAQAIKNGTI